MIVKRVAPPWPADGFRLPVVQRHCTTESDAPIAPATRQTDPDRLARDRQMDPRTGSPTDDRAGGDRKPIDCREVLGRPSSRTRSRALSSGLTRRVAGPGYITARQAMRVRPKQRNEARRRWATLRLDLIGCSRSGRLDCRRQDQCERQPVLSLTGLDTLVVHTRPNGSRYRAWSRGADVPGSGSRQRNGLVRSRRPSTQVGSR